MSTLHKRFARKSIHTLKKDHRTTQKSIFIDLDDQCEALYYLGLTYHLKAKEFLNSNSGLITDDIRKLLQKSIVYYQ